MWYDCAPDARQCVYIANHTSHLDFLVLWAALPASIRRATRPVAARDYWDASPVRRFLAVRVFRALLIDRKTGGMAGDAVLRPMVEALEHGDSLILFPEGTRGGGLEMGPFKSGIYHMCRLRPGLELSPVYLENLNRILPKGEFLMAPLMSRVHFGPRIRLEDGELKPEFLTRARECVARLQEA
jgi:1-acyl-sn-glycerol-3-phosphate acyltransferase